MLFRLLLLSIWFGTGCNNQPPQNPVTVNTPPNTEESASPPPAIETPNIPFETPPDLSEPTTSFIPVAITEAFEQLMARLSGEKDEVMGTQSALLNARYDLSDTPIPGLAMTRGKPIQGGIRVKVGNDQTFESLAKLTPKEIREKGLFPDGFKPLPHAKHVEGGMVFPTFHIKEIIEQDNRDLQRFDIDYDTPEHFLPEFPPAIFLSSRQDLGDVSSGKVITRRNFFEIFDGILTPKQLDGLRLLVEPLPQQQFNLTSDRRSPKAHEGVACLDCHVNGHTNAAFHLDPHTRPQEARRRIDTPTLRGVNIQRLFGSQRALKSVEDFTEFEQRAAYFDGDIVIATKKGMRPLERGSEVANMSEFQSLLGFPPAPKLRVADGKLDPSLASERELRGQELFFGKAQCSSCHVPPYYTDNLMHDLKTERFYEPQNINERMAKGDGPIKTFPLRGIKESPPYLHDGRLLTLADTVEFFNLVLSLDLSGSEKEDLVEFMLAL